MNRQRRIVVSLFLLTALSLFSACSLIVDWSVSSDRKNAGLVEKSIQVGDHHIAYLEGGSGKDPTVVLLHGFGANKDNWLHFARYLKDGYHVVIPDLPGFGDSSKIIAQKYDVDTQTARIHEFAAKLGLMKFHIAGNSMGGVISGLYAANYPDDVLSLGLLNPGGIIDREPSGLSRSLASGVNPLVIEKPADFDRMVDFLFARPPVIPSFAKSVLAERAMDASDFNKKVFAEATPRDQLEKRLPDIKVRTLVIWGDTDRIFPPSSAYVIGGAVKNAQILIMKDCGHIPMVERPEETARHYIAFIQ